MIGLWLLLALVVFIVIARIVGTAGRLLQLKIEGRASRIADHTELPAGIHAGLSDSVDALRDAGFLFDHLEERRDLEAAVAAPRWVAVYRNAAERSYAEVTTARSPDGRHPVALSFVTLYPALRLTTLGPSESVIGVRGGGNELHQSGSPDIETHWQIHRLALRRHEDALVDARPERIHLEENAYVTRHDRDIRHYLSALSDQGLLAKERGHRYGLRWAGIRSLLFDRKNRLTLPEGTALPSEITPVLSGDPLGALEMDAYRRRQQLEDHTPTSAAFKWVVLLGSGLLCYLFLGSLLDFGWMLYLMAVLLLHESGHLLAMSLFGYSDKAILFTPVGALATGRRDDAPTWQRMVVFLAGPLPGIVLAFVLLLVLPELNDTASTFIIMLLIVNTLNLLPIMPLDGGQIVNLALTSRLPRLQFGLHVLSFLAAGVITSVMQDGFVLMICIWLGLGLKDSYRNIALLRACHAHRAAGDGHDESIRHLFHLMRRSSLDFDARYAKARHFSSILQRRPDSVPASAALVLVYVLSLLSPTFLLINDAGGITSNAIARSSGSDETLDLPEFSHSRP